MMSANLPSFDPDFASPFDWARLYRACGLQAVPGRYPMRDKTDKRPLLSKWGQFADDLVRDAIFATFFGPDAKPNMGLITGRASGNVFVLDLDTHTKAEAGYWWRAQLECEAMGIEPETWKQVTGGGGRQLFFRAPPGWHAPTNRTPIGVDIRGQGGFALLPPTQHYSGKEYAWAPGCEPWSVPIADAPQWLLDAIDRLVEQYGGDKGASELGPQERAPAAEADFDAFGARVDGREDAMAKWVWRSVLELHRDCRGVMPDDGGKERCGESLAQWLLHTKTRLKGVDNVEGLERECRGPSAFMAKWVKAMKKWEGKVSEQAAAPRPFADEPRAEPPARPVDPVTGAPLPLILTAAQFVADFTPPAYLIDGMMQRGYVYSFTARTGHGKTAVSMYLGQCVARGLPMAGHAVEQGSVLFLAGENPDDVRARFLVLADTHGFSPADVPFFFVAGVIDIEEELPRIREAAASIPDLRLVIVDTAAAYFKGDDGNSNVQQGAYARLLRELSFVPGKPAVLIPTHPAKHATKESLTPVGGGAFLNEVDGNLTLWADADKHLSMHWQGKFRGPEFEPVSFKLRTVTSERVVDANGVLMPSVVAEPISEDEASAAHDREMSLTIRMLFAVQDHRNASVARLATACRLVDDKGSPQKSKAFRLLQRLASDKLVEVVLGKYRLTQKGRNEIGIDD